MKKYFTLFLFTLALGVLSSCNKCKKLDCKNDATCEKREGICNCNFLYAGEFCENEVRNNYVGTYDGTISYPDPTNPLKSNSNPLTINVIVEGNEANSLGVKFNFLDSDYAFTGRLTERNVFVADAKKLSVEGFGEITVLETSKGTFSGDVLNATINLRLESYPQIPVRLTFVGEK